MGCPSKKTTELGVRETLLPASALLSSRWRVLQSTPHVLSLYVVRGSRHDLFTFRRGLRGLRLVKLIAPTEAETNRLS